MKPIRTGAQGVALDAGGVRIRLEVSIANPAAADLDRTQQLLTQVYAKAFANTSEALEEAHRAG